MKIAVLGGGPSGLYFAISMKLRDAAHEITVYERNRADDTFGWGVVLSDETMSNLDEDTTQVLVDGIKEKCSDKLVVIIAHQVVSGVFDKTIEIQ